MKYLFAILALLANATSFSAEAEPMDIEIFMWQCFDQGHYTHQQTVSMLTHPELHNYILIEGADLRKACILLAETLEVTP